MRFDSFGLNKIVEIFPTKDQLVKLHAANLDLLSTDLHSSQFGIKRHRTILFQNQDHHRAEASFANRIDERVDQRTAYAVALIFTQQVDRVEFPVVAVNAFSCLASRHEPYHVRLAFSHQDDRASRRDLLPPHPGSRPGIERRQKDVGQDSRVGAFPAFHIHMRDRAGIHVFRPSDRELHVPESTTSSMIDNSPVRSLRYPESMTLPTLPMIHDAQALLYRHMTPTPQYSWPLLNERLETEAWIKHENHTAVGAFKLRGALVYIDWLRQSQWELAGVVAATRGNHGQGVGMAARLMGIRAVIIVPHGNSKEKNRAMLAQGVELIEHGHDFQESLEFARTLAAERGFAMVDSFHERLVMGTATYALEFFQATPPLDRVYVPIGLGSSICGVSAARNALGLKTEIIGVVSAESPSYALSFSQRKVVESPSRTLIADGLACRLPNAHAMEAIWNNVSRIVEVTDAEIAEAMRVYYRDTHNLAEGAGAAALAAALKEKPQHDRRRIGIILTGGNVDAEMFSDVLNGAM